MPLRPLPHARPRKTLHRRQRYAELEAPFLAYRRELSPSEPGTPGEFALLAAEWQNDPDRWLWWGINEAGERVGFVIFRKFRDFPDRRKWVGSIAEFTILPAHRRKGHGRALVRRAIEELKAAGCAKVEAAVLWERSVSLAFWEAAGFRPVYVLTELDVSSR